MGMMRKLAQAYPQTQLWMDSIIPQQIDFGLENACHGVTTAPTVTAFAVKHNQAPWLELAASIHGQHPEYSEQQLLWACMYQVSREQAKKLLPLFHEDSFGMDGHLAIQADIYGFNNAEAMIAQAKVIHSLGPNFIIKIPTTQAGLAAMEEIAASGHSVLATSCSSVAQVDAAGAALTRGYQRHMAAGGRDGGMCLSIAMQLGFQNMCIVNYAKENGISLSAQAQDYGAIAVGKRAYALVKEKYPQAAFMLSNLKSDAQIQEFIGGDILLTVPYPTHQRIDSWETLPENCIDRPVPEAVTAELLEKIPHYKKTYLADGMRPAEFRHSIPFCRTIHEFLYMYEDALRTIRGVIIPDRYGNGTPTAY